MKRCFVIGAILSCMACVSIFGYAVYRVNAGARDAFFQLCREGTPQQIRDAIKAGANVYARNKNGTTALMAAARYNSNPDVIYALLEGGADVNAHDVNGLNALIRAAAKNNPDVALALLDAGADVNAKATIIDTRTTKEYDLTPLMSAASFNSNPEMISLLVREGANLNDRDELGWTALMNAAIDNNPDVIARLIKLGADVNAKNDHGETALMFAAFDNKNPEVVRVLLKNGADINHVASDGTTALTAAATKNGNPDVISLLLDAGADVNARNNKDKRAADYAAENKALADTEAYRRLAELSK